MPIVLVPPQVAISKQTGETIRGGTGKVYADTDYNLTSELTCYTDATGGTPTQPQSSSEAIIPEFWVNLPESAAGVFWVAAGVRVWLASRDTYRGRPGSDGSDGKTAYQYAVEGGYQGSEADFRVEQREVGEAATNAAASAAEAQAAREAAEAALGRVDAPTDTVVADLVDRGTSSTQASLNARYASKEVATSAAAGLMAAADKAKLDAATFSNVANALVSRSASGQIQVATPTQANSAATKGYVDLLAVTQDLPTGVDLDTYQADGFYRQVSSASAAAGSNYPVPNAGLLVVRNLTSMTFQEYEVNVGSAVNKGRRFWRSRFGGSWGPWQEVADTATTLRTTVSRLMAGVGAGAALPPNYDIGTDGTVVALGYNAMSAMTQVKKSIAIGPHALGEGTISRDNVAIGEDALRFTQAVTPNYSQSETDGTRLVAIGGNALRFNVHGVGHVAVGRNAGQNMVGGTGLVAIGNGAHASQCPIGLSGKIENWSPAGGTATNTYNVTAIGQWSLARNTHYSATAVGASALRSQVVSAHNVAIGPNALRRIDEDAWFNGGTVYTKDITGTYSQAGNTLTINAAAHGAAVGDIVLLRLTSGGSQTFAGDYAPAEVTAVPGVNSLQVQHPTSRTASGDALLGSVVKPVSPPKSEMNTVVGTDAFPYLKSGNYNGGFGYRAGFNLGAGQSNMFLGYESGAEVTTANSDTALGVQALKGATGSTSTEATAVGYQALSKVTTGSYGVAVGYRAGYEVTTGNYTTALGYSAGRNTVSGGNMQGFNNTTCIGWDSRISADNQVQLGNSSTTTYVYGTVQNRSDLRDKADVRDTKLGLEFVKKLRPVDFRWDMRDDYLQRNAEGELVQLPKDGSKKRARYHHGLVAQEVASVAATLGVEFGGYQDHSISGGDDVLSIGYDELIAPVIKAVQQLAARVETLEGH